MEGHNTSALFHRKAELLIQFSCFNRNSGYFGPFGQQGPAINYWLADDCTCLWKHDANGFSSGTCIKWSGFAIAS